MLFSSKSRFDLNRDGIGDIPYIFIIGCDRYPLMGPYPDVVSNNHNVFEKTCSNNEIYMGQDVVSNL